LKASTTGRRGSFGDRRRVGSNVKRAASGDESGGWLSGKPPEEGISDAAVERNKSTRLREE
jgi:hypothetical protein